MDKKVKHWKSGEEEQWKKESKTRKKQMEEKGEDLKEEEKAKCK